MYFKHTKKACEISDKILQKCIKNMRVFETERDIFNFLKNETEKQKCMLSFDPVVASGKNGAEMHHKATNSKLKKGFLVLDFGVKYKGYCSDMTRTIYLGKPNKKERDFYYLVLNAQKISISELKAEMSCFVLDGVARSVFGKYAKFFRHGLGHGVGRKIHQSPSLSPWNRRKIKDKTILTIEPGLYFKNKFGIRIEDTLFLNRKPFVLTKTKKNLIIIQ